MANPSWCTGHCALVLCVGIMVRVSYCLEPSDHDIVPMVSSVGSPHKAQAPSCLRGEGVGCTRPHAVAATGCTPHMSWSSCVCVLESRLCVLRTPKAVPWCPFGAVKASLGGFLI
uniref:Secreted protein n=1 Tax=Vitis vinifera TaxID=29760 RepID=A5C558_VITVI|nr:hypothetical protein VITISV_043671 [Vitis vinifera]